MKMSDQTLPLEATTPSGIRDWGFLVSVQHFTSSGMCLQSTHTAFPAVGEFVEVENLLIGEDDGSLLEPVKQDHGPLQRALL